MENLGKNEQRRMKARIAELERQLAQEALNRNCAEAAAETALKQFHRLKEQTEELEAKLAALEALCRDYITNLDDGYDVLASHATDRIREAINPPAKGAADGN